MFRFLLLIQNEWIKIHLQKSTQVMMIILVIAVVFAGSLTRYLPQKMDPDSHGDWRVELTKRTAVARENEKTVPENARMGYVKEIAINEYRLANNIPPMEKTLWGFVRDAQSLITLVALIVIMIGSGIVAREFSQGTAKLLLIRPFSRWKILLSKYITVLLVSLELLLLLLVSSILTGALYFGFAGAFMPHLVFVGGQVQEQSMLLFDIGLYLLSSINMIMLVTMAFMVSTVFRNSMFAVVLSIALLFMGSASVQLLAGFKIDWARYMLFANTDLTQYLDGIPLMEGMTMSFSIGVLLVYFTLFIATAFLSFTRRDVA